jgi:beta-phosphoglucomutase-like phosphatase (HAD superfamily)
VASNGERSNVVESLNLTGLKKHFVDGHIFTKIQVKNPKPHPDLFLFAATQMGVAPENCVVIEDSAAGVRAGVAAGMMTFGFTGASHDPIKQAEILKSAGATAVYPRLIHIREHLYL